MLENVVLEDTSMRDIACNVYFQQLSTLSVLSSGVVYSINRCGSIQYRLSNDECP